MLDINAIFGENFPDRLMIVQADRVLGMHTPPFPPDAPAIIPNVDPCQLASLRDMLGGVYPPDHPVEWIGESDRQSLSLKNIADVAGSGHGTLLVHALPEGSSFELFQEVIAHLRAPDGCPWDRKQTHGSLRPYLLEETYEALTALDAEDPGKMAEELGDLLLQIVLHAQIGSETGAFRMTDILRGIHDKIIRRHPHVFGDVVVHDEGGVLVNWERLKAEERAVNGEPEKGMLDGVPVALPALTQAQEIQERAARVGFDWQDIEPVRRKILEELGEVDMAGDSVEREKELGDLLFAVVNLVRWHGVDAESALRETNQRFRNRFSYIEKRSRQTGKPLLQMSLEEMDVWWEEAKDLE